MDRGSSIMSLNLTRYCWLQKVAPGTWDTLEENEEDRKARELFQRDTAASGGT